jgi:hypothetical protein
MTESAKVHIVDQLRQTTASVPDDRRAEGQRLHHRPLSGIGGAYPGQDIQNSVYDI